MLPKEAIDEYKVLYKKRFGVDLSDAEASFRANNLVNLYRAVLGPEPKGYAPIKENPTPGTKLCLNLLCNPELQTLLLALEYSSV